MYLCDKVKQAAAAVSVTLQQGARDARDAAIKDAVARAKAMEAAAEAASARPAAPAAAPNAPTAPAPAVSSSSYIPTEAEIVAAMKKLPIDFSKPETVEERREKAKALVIQAKSK